MTSVRNARTTTFGILALAAAIAVGSFFLHRARSVAETGTPPAPEPPASQVAEADGVTLQAMLQSASVLQGTHETYLAVTLGASDQHEVATRPPLNVAVVIDRSGSMKGEKIVHAKQAAKQLLAQLDERDRFAIVSYGSEVEVVFGSQSATGTAKEAAAIAIDGIYDDGGTNLSGGLEAGTSQLLGHRTDGAVSRVVLISDGRANEGIIDQEGLARVAAETAQRGVSITTVGVGLDFDERIMTRLAVAGRGNYYFVESSAVLAQMFSDELEKLGATTATNVELTVRPSAGVEIVEALGYPIYRSAGAARIPVADLHAGEHRKIVLKLRVSAPRLGAMDLAAIDARYRTVGSDQASHVSLASNAEVVADADAWRAGLNKEAAIHIERARAAAAINEATRLYEEGRTDEATIVLDGYDSSAAQYAADLGDREVAAELEEKVRARAMKAKKALSADPAPASTAGKRSRKSNRADAYDLFTK